MSIAELELNTLFVGTVAMFLVLIFVILILFILYRRKQYDLWRKNQDSGNNLRMEILKTQLETQEATFHKIGEELHDNIGQLLSSTRMLLGIAERSLHEVPDTFRTADQTLAKAIQDLRMLSKSLNREWLNQFNLLENLQVEIERINIAGKIQVEMQASVKLLPLNPETQVMLFRVVQEAIHNTVKHAAASKMSISANADATVKFVVRDNGNGLNVNLHGPAGFELAGMKTRTSLLGGIILFSSDKLKGTEVSIEIPAQND